MKDKPSVGSSLKVEKHLFCVKLRLESQNQKIDKVISLNGVAVA